MKMKQLAGMMMAITMTTMMVTGCGSDTGSTSNEVATEAITEVGDEAVNETEMEESAEEETSVLEPVTIGISQFAVHGSLDNCKDGFLAGLAEEGYVEGDNLEVIFDNAQSDMGMASTIADNFVSRNVDLICGIATPSAMTAYNSTMGTDIPVIYSAVTDTIAAGFTAEDGSNTGNITGTSDALPIALQLQMIRDILPDATTIGIIYTTSEANSISAIEEYQLQAPAYGFEIVATGINTIADVSLAAADMVGKVDCINNLTDNTVVSALQVVVEAANAKNIPVFGSEVEQVKAGCVASQGLDYFDLGIQTGVMAAQVLSGAVNIADLPFQVITEAQLYINTAAAEKIGLILEESFIVNAAEIFEEIVVE
ncbi:MAG: ABC transporter substrate-binding protein [Eubacteriales bacterium]